LEFLGAAEWGSGVVTFMNGELFGGDSWFLFKGRYTTESNNLTAEVFVSRFAPGPVNVMGKDEFHLNLTGTLNEAGNSIVVNGTVPGTTLNLAGTMQKRRDLPR
jgi:hypothetical protein